MTKVHAAIEIASAGPQHPGGFVHQTLRDGWDYPLNAFQEAHGTGSDAGLAARPQPCSREHGSGV